MMVTAIDVARKRRETRGAH